MRDGRLILSVAITSQGVLMEGEQISHEIKEFKAGGIHDTRKYDKITIVPLFLSQLIWATAPLIV